MGNETFQMECIKYGYPTPVLPFYHIVFLMVNNTKSNMRISKTTVNGRNSRDTLVFLNGKPQPENIIPGNSPAELVVRANWENGSANSVEIGLQDDAGKTFGMSCSSRAPQNGGYWNKAWNYYSATVIREENGIDRKYEPVHLQLGYYTERISSPENEIRVVEIDPLSGAAREIPSQVYDVMAGTELKTDEAQPTVSLRVAFLADVPANTAKVFLVFYGNKNAAKPQYVTDLSFTENGYEVIAENSFYKIKTHPKSGQLDEVYLKQNVDVLWEHKVETNGALHWNPDLYAPPRIWTHASDWDPPPSSKTIRGPVFCMTKRWGALPEYPDTHCCVTYVFYAYQPYMLMDSNLDILEAMNVRALRNGELVVNLAVADSFAWKEPGNKIRSIRFEDRPKEPRRALDFSDKSSWWAFTNFEKRAALASVILGTNAVRKDTGLADSDKYITLKWGPWAYCTKPFAYSFNSPNPQRLIHVPANSSFSEKLAFAPLRLGAEDETRFEAIEHVSDKLRMPLSVSEAWMEVDDRVPEPWGRNFPYPYPDM